MYLMAMADAADDDEAWWDQYIFELEDAEDPMVLIKPEAIEPFKERVRGSRPPVTWGDDGVWTCHDRETMFTALHWFLPEIPESACAELRLYGFSFEDPCHPVNPEFRVNTREKNLKLSMRWDRWTRPKARTKDESVYT